MQGGKAVVSPRPTRCSTLVYGRPGHIKTPFVTTLPTWMQPVLMVNCDAGGESADSVFDNHKRMTTRADPETGLPPGLPTLEDPWNMILLNSPKLDSDTYTRWDWLTEVLTWPHWMERFGIRTLVFDGVTTIGKELLLGMAQTQMFVAKNRQGEVVGATPYIGKGVDTRLHVPDMGTYNATQNAMVALRTYMQAFPWNVIVVAHQTYRTEDSPQGKEIISGPDLPGRAIIQTWTAEWSQVIRMKETGNRMLQGEYCPRFVAQLVHDGMYPARTRSQPRPDDRATWECNYDHEKFWEWLFEHVGIPKMKPLGAYEGAPVGATYVPTLAVAAAAKGSAVLPGHKPKK